MPSALFRLFTVKKDWCPPPPRRRRHPMPDFPLFDLAPAVYWLRGVFPFDLLALFVVMLFGFWTAAGAAWVVGAIGRR